MSDETPASSAADNTVSPGSTQERTRALWASATHRGEPGQCPSCERYIGPVDVCPYCEADADTPLAIRRLRWIALTLAIPGLVFLYLAARQTTAPTIRAGDISPLMNFARVRAEGVIVGRPFLQRNEGEAGYATMVIDDGSGRIRVTVDGDAASALISGGTTPKPGTHVQAEGILSVEAEGMARLRVSSPSLLVLSPDRAVKP